MKFFVMAKTVIKSLLRKPATRKYPFGPMREFFENSRGSVAINIGDCIFCGMCQRKCPTKAITVTKENRQWKIDRMKCIACGCCVENCPKKCLIMEPQYTAPSTEKKEDVYQDA